MNIQEISCTQCLMNNNIPGVQIGEDGICNFCSSHKPFQALGEDTLIGIINKARSKKRLYDALVPLSGGKDSTYVLYLAVKKYKLSVLTYTYDNGFMSSYARSNIEAAVKMCNVDHVWVKHDEKLIFELYNTALKYSGEICGICGVGIERSMLKISEAYRIPIILLGHSPVEHNSFTSQDIYDQSRLKAILKMNKGITDEMINRFLLYPRLNYISSFLYTQIGRFGRKVNILYYLENPTYKEIGELLKREMDWVEPLESKYTRHFDCHAEPFTNYIREKRYGSSRRLPQLSNMIRNKEMTKEEAIEILSSDQIRMQITEFDKVIEKLKLSKEDIDGIEKIPFDVFSQNGSFANKVFALARKALKGG